MLIETERLRLRPMEVGDLDEFVALHADPEVAEFIRLLDRTAAGERLRRAEVEWREQGHGLLAMLDRKSGVFLGRCGLKHWPQFGETELGWVLRSDAWGHGYNGGRLRMPWVGLRGVRRPVPDGDGQP